TGGWQLLTAFEARNVSINGSDEVAATFDDFGVWTFTTFWTQVDGRKATQVGIGNDGHLFATFDGQGIWEFISGTGFRQISGLNPEEMAVPGTGPRTEV